jgi:hypothetical protein
MNVLNEEPRTANPAVRATPADAEVEERCGMGRKARPPDGDLVRRGRGLEPRPHRPPAGYCTVTGMFKVCERLPLVAVTVAV